VAKGYSQQYSVNYKDTYTPVVHIKQLQMLLAYATALGLAVHQANVVTAFLQANLCKIIHADQPKGFKLAKYLTHVCWLIKSLYGLKQAPLTWNVMTDQHLHGIGFVSTSADPCIYIKGQGHNIMVISIYIDNCLLIADNSNIPALKQILSDHFNMKDLGQVASILGIEVLHNKEAGLLCLHQCGHILLILEAFHLMDSKPTWTPLPIGLQLTKIDCTPDNCKDLPYRSAIGKLLYIMLATQLDIAFAITYLCQFCNAYNQSHWNATKHLIQYLKSTINQVIHYKRQESNVSHLAPVTYCDANFTGDINSCKSISAYVFIFASGPIMWNASFQKVVLLSSTEAEYIALTHVCKQAIFSWKLLAPLRLNSTTPMTIYSDSQSAIAIANSPQLNNKLRLKHFNVKVHFICDMVHKRVVHVEYCPTTKMLADYLTKILPRPAFKYLKLKTRLQINNNSTT
jgi:hypothetical protein